MTAKTAAPIVLAVIACRLNSGSKTASIEAKTDGKYSGLHPAITEFIAIFSTVIVLFFTGSIPTTSEGSRFECDMASITFFSVGSIIGSPSVHPLVK